MKKLLFALLALCLAALSGCARADGVLRAAFLEAGAADAILIQTEHSAVLVDTGLKKNADELVAALREAGVERLDALVITHYDKDHVGGAPAVLENFKVETIYQPDYVKDGGAYERWQKALKKTDAQVCTLCADTAFELDGARWEITAAAQRAYKNDESNNFSLVLRLEWGETSFLLAGDCERERLAELLEAGVEPCDVLKVPHHGRLDEMSGAFFEAASPRYAVVTSDEDEPEDAETLALLEALGAQVLLTRQGVQTFTSDGTTVAPAAKN